jgi:predicted Zn-dependent protease
MAQSIIARAATLLIALTVGLTATPLGMAQGSLPQLGDGQEMSVAAERALGQRIAREIYRDPDYLDDPVIGEYVQRIWQPLVQAARARGDITPELFERFAWQVMLARDRSVNAFALPGGYLGLHLGLIAIVGNRDELASVLAHELSHVTQRHIARNIAKQNQQAPLVLGAMILGILAASKNPEAANAVIAGSQAAGAQLQLNFSRDMEREADRVGYQVMQDAQLNVQGFVGMFDKLALANRINDNGSFPYLRTHPLTSERIGDMQSRLQLNPPVKTNPGSVAEAQALALEHAIITTRARLLADPSVDKLRAELGRARALPASSASSGSSAAPGTAKASSQRISQLYGGALAALRLRDLPSASSLAASAAQTMDLEANTASAQAKHARLAIDLIVAEIAMAQGEHARAQALMQPYLQGSVLAKPGQVTIARSALLLWAQSVSAHKASASDLPQVVDKLQTWTAVLPQDAPAWDALAAAYSAQNQGLRAIRAQAEARVALLDYTAALDRLKAGQDLARRSASTDHIELSIIDSRARALQVLVRELQSDKLTN